MLHHTKLVQPYQTCCVSLRDILFLKSPLHLVNPMCKEDVDEAGFSLCLLNCFEVYHTQKDFARELEDDGKDD